MPDDLAVPIVLAAVSAGVCWLLSIVSGEHSWVDRLWSILPPVYAVWFAVAAPRPDARLVLMAALVVAWGARLTYNFARKGGYRRGGEDYRWPVLRQRIPPPLFALFNLVFICAIQHALLLVLVLPSWVALRQGPAPAGPLDYLATALFVLFLAGETVADQQQWRFHLDKAARQRRGGPKDPEFLSTGLFRYSRHPNFFCEQAIWWSYYLFGVAAGADWLNPSLLGPVLLTLLFQGSTAFTESITAAKYPAYATYQRQTSRLLPLPVRRPRHG